MNGRRPVLYIAGPYTRPDPIVNTHAAAKVGAIVADLTGWAPMVPHITLLWHAITPRNIDFWYRLDLDHMANCQGVVRLPGESSGADAEMAWAVENGMNIIEYTTLPWRAQLAWGERLNLAAPQTA